MISGSNGKTFGHLKRFVATSQRLTKLLTLEVSHCRGPGVFAWLLCLLSVSDSQAFL